MSNEIVTTGDTKFTETRKGLNELSAIHDAQLLSYLKLSSMKVGLLINFNVRTLTQGVHRKVLGPLEEVSL